MKILDFTWPIFVFLTKNYGILSYSIFINNSLYLTNDTI